MTIYNLIENSGEDFDGNMRIDMSSSGQDGVDMYDTLFSEGPGTWIDAYGIRPTDAQALSIDSRPLPEIGDMYEFALYAKNNSGSDMTFQNHLEFNLAEYSGDTLGHDYLFKMDINKDGTYEFNQVITVDQMRAGFTTEAWTQQIDNGFAGEYAIGSLEVVPEPVTMGLLAIGGLAALVGSRVKRHFRRF